MATKNKKKKEGIFYNIKPKAIARTRKDIESWNSALKYADREEDTRRDKLIEIYEHIMLDATLSSQIDQRIERIISSEINVLNHDGSIDENETKKLASDTNFTCLVKYAEEAIFWGFSLIEFTRKENGEPEINLIPRRNVVPEQGFVYPDLSQNKKIEYRNSAAFGVSVVEFDSGNYGLINKAVPHALFKRFAHSCWSELCEIYGIPPRYVKTDTQNPEMLSRAEEMLRDMGSAAYFIIDTTEEFKFAEGVSTDGSIYDNLIRLCNNEMSMLITGAIIGQDTIHGNRSKEEIAQEMFLAKVEADKKVVENFINTSAMPAMVYFGLIPEGKKVKFVPAEDTEMLWKRTTEAMPYYDIEAAWIEQKFGIKVTERKNNNDFF